MERATSIVPGLKITVVSENFKTSRGPSFGGDLSMHVNKFPTRDPVPLSQEMSCMHPYSLPPLFHAFVVTTEPSAYKKIN
jgi:hypothetical protein